MIKVQAPGNQDIQIQMLDGPKLVPAGAKIALDVSPEVAQKLGFLIIEDVAAEVVAESDASEPADAAKRVGRSRK